MKTMQFVGGETEFSSLFSNLRNNILFDTPNIKASESFRFGDSIPTLSDKALEQHHYLKEKWGQKFLISASNA